MEADEVKREMANRLVFTMNPETAKGVLLKVIEGDDIYGAILASLTTDSDKPVPFPKRRYRKTKKTTNLQPESSEA